MAVFHAQGLYETCLLGEDHSLQLINDEEQSSYDEAHLLRLKNSLSGVPPPPAVTYPTQNVGDILNAVRGSQQSPPPAAQSPRHDAAPLLWRLFTQQRARTVLDFLGSLNASAEPLGPGHGEQNCDTGSQINENVSFKTSEESSMDCQPIETVRELEIENLGKFYDIGYNINNLSEKIAELYDKYRERFVGCETSSFVTSNSPSKYFGKKKEKLKWVGRSPARRAAFQKTRRKVFSSLSLQAARQSGIFGHEKRTILIDRQPKKKDSKQISRALFASPEERKASTSDLVKQSPSRLKSIEMRRSLWMRRKLHRRSTPNKQTPKKCGTTPSKRTPRKGHSGTKRTPRKSGTPAKCTPKKGAGGGTPKRFLSPRKSGARKSSEGSRLSGLKLDEGDCLGEINENGKRRRLEDVCPTHSLPYASSAGEDDLRSDNPLELSDTQRRVSDAGGTHDAAPDFFQDWVLLLTESYSSSHITRPKLLWAVSASLKQAGIGSSHKHFRLCGRKLYKICKNFWTSCPSNRNVKVGISEKMLSLATEHVNNVIKEIDDQNFSSNSLELYSQDSNSCDFFFKSNDSQNES